MPVSISNSFPDLLFHIHCDGTFLGYIARDESTLVVSPTEILGRTVAEILPENIAKAAELAIGRAVNTGDQQSFDYSLMKDGTLVEYEASIIPGKKNDALVIVHEKSALRSDFLEDSKTIDTEKLGRHRSRKLSIELGRLS